MDSERRARDQTGEREVVGINVHAAILAGSFGVALNLGVTVIAVYLKRRH